MNSKFDDWDSTIDIWKSGQMLLPKAIRWSKYVKNDGTREQNTLQHSYSLALLGEIALLKLKGYSDYDHGLFLTSCLLHDHGEGELARDILYIDKTSDEHLNEYKAFAKRFSLLPQEIYESLEQAFLLQFAQLPDNELSDFPPQAQKQIEYLRANKKLEIIAFEALERWDYILYALEQYKEQNNEKILVQVLRHQIPHLNILSDELPGFRQEIWTDEARKWHEDFVNAREGKWIEQKNET